MKSLARTLLDVLSVNVILGQAQLPLDRKLAELAGFGKAASVVLTKAMLAAYLFLPSTIARLFCP